MTTFLMQCTGASPVGTAPADMTTSYVTTAQCIWVEQPPGLLPPMTATQGFEIAGVIIALWSVGLIIRHVTHIINH